MSFLLAEDETALKKSEVVNWYLKEIESEIDSEIELINKKAVIEKIIYRLVHYVRKHFHAISISLWISYMRIFCVEATLSVKTKNVFTFIFIRIIFWLSWHSLGWKDQLSPVEKNPRRKMLRWWSTPTTHLMTKHLNFTFSAVLTQKKRWFLRWRSGRGGVPPVLSFFVHF